MQAPSLSWTTVIFWLNAIIVIPSQTGWLRLSSAEACLRHVVKGCPLCSFPLWLSAGCDPLWVCLKSPDPTFRKWRLGSPKMSDTPDLRVNHPFKGANTNTCTHNWASIVPAEGFPCKEAFGSHNTHIHAQDFTPPYWHLDTRFPNEPYIDVVDTLALIGETVEVGHPWIKCCH